MCIGGVMGMIKIKWLYFYGRRFNVSCIYLKFDSVELYKI